MKRVSPLQSASLAALLTVVIGTGLVGTDVAQAKTTWNPVSWFSYDASEADRKAAEKQAEEAKRLADEAKKQADLAAEAARKAEERAKESAEAAERAAAKAEERRSEYTPPPTRTDIRAQAEAGASTTPGFIPTTPNFSEESDSKGWSLKSMFTFGHKAPANATREATETAPATTPTAAQPQKEDQPAVQPKAQQETRQEAPKQTSNSAPSTEQGNRWKLKNLFGQSGETPEAGTMSKTEPAISAAAVVDPVIRQQAAMIETEKGNIVIELYPDAAPQTVSNFAKLVQDGFYNKYNMKFHRVVPGFVIQTGDPTGTGAGGSKERIPLEVKNKLTHNAKGMVAMARGPDPNSATSQFYITLAPQTSLDAKYAIFGKVVSGLEVLDKIEKNDMLYGVRLIDLSAVKPDTPQQSEKKGFFSRVF